MVADTIPLVLNIPSTLGARSASKYPEWIQRLFLLLLTHGSEIFIWTSTWGEYPQQNAVAVMCFQGLLKQKFKNTLYEENIMIAVYAIGFKIQENL